MEVVRPPFQMVGVGVETPRPSIVWSPPFSRISFGVVMIWGSSGAPYWWSDCRSGCGTAVVNRISWDVSSNVRSFIMVTIGGDEGKTGND